jgi:acetyl esterase/lipase
MPSPAARAMPIVIRLTGRKKTFSSEKLTRAEMEQLNIRPKSFGPPRSLDEQVHLSVRLVNGWPVYTVTPKAGTSRRRAMYIHGGAWYHEITSEHWKLIAEVANLARAQFTVPIYPLALEGTAASVVPGVADLAAGLVDEVGAENVTIMGDSAGGNITLAAALLLRDRGVPPLHQIILIAPCLDASFTDPVIAQIAPTDPWLAPEGPRAAAELWRGELPIDDPMVSPITGDLKGLGRITLFSGTRDITHADAKRLVQKAKAVGSPLDYHEGRGLLHVYPLMPIPEGKAARAVMARAITQ